jgi:hypothetical protein
MDLAFRPRRAKTQQPLRAVRQDRMQSSCLLSLIDAIEKAVKRTARQLHHPAMAAARQRLPTGYGRPAPTGIDCVHAVILPHGLSRRNHGLLRR